MNSQPLEHQSSPITASSGLSPMDDGDVQCDQIWRFIGLWATF